MNPTSSAFSMTLPPTAFASRRIFAHRAGCSGRAVVPGKTPLHHCRCRHRRRARGALGAASCICTCRGFDSSFSTWCFSCLLLATPVIAGVRFLGFGSRTPGVAGARRFLILISFAPARRDRCFVCILLSPSRPHGVAGVLVSLLRPLRILPLRWSFCNI